MSGWLMNTANTAWFWLVKLDKATKMKLFAEAGYLLINNLRKILPGAKA